MKKVQPLEAANTIRAEFGHPDGELNHQVRFALIVCDYLGVPRTPENAANVMRLLSEHDIEGTTYEPFPGWFTNERGEMAICANEEDSKAFMARPAPINEDGSPNPASGSIDANCRFIPAPEGTESVTSSPVAGPGPVSPRARVETPTPPASTVQNEAAVQEKQNEAAAQAAAARQGADAQKPVPAS